MSSNNAYEIFDLAWDSNYFGIPCGRINIERPLAEYELAGVLDAARRYVFTTISCAAGLAAEREQIGRLSNAFLADVNVQLTAAVGGATEPGDPCVVIANRAGHDPAITDIAAESFTQSRFFNDPHITPEQAKAVYSNWTANAFGLEAKYYALYRECGETRGFALFDVSGQDLTVELMAATQSYRGRGIGKKLVQTILAFAAEHDITAAHTGTQIENIKTLGLFQRQGFQIRTIRYIYHLWNFSQLEMD